MDVQEIVQKIDPEKFDSLQYNKIKKEKISISNNEKKYLNKILSSAKSRSKKEILCSIITYAIWCPNEAIVSARQKGIFRYKTSQTNKKNNAKYYLGYLEKYSKILGFSEKTYSYLIQKKSCDWLEDIYNDLDKKIDKLIAEHYGKRIRKRINNCNYESSLHKELLVYIDMIFFEGVRSEQTDLNDISHYSQEEIAEGVSYLLYKYLYKYEVSPKKNYFVDTSYLLSKKIDELVLNACYVNYLLEIELLIDFYDYDVFREGREICIRCKDSSLEKSIRNGFAKTEMQEYIFYNRNTEPKDGAYISNVSQMTLDKLKDECVNNVDSGPLSRYVFKIPIKIIEYLGRQEASGKVSVYMEEKMQIDFFIKELFMTADDFYNKKITEHCTLVDIMLCQRLFKYIYYMQKRVYEEEKDIKKVLRSLIPINEKNNFIKCINLFLNDTQKAQEIYTLLKYDNKYKFDIQYTPLIEIGNKVIFPVSILACSNMLRNTIAYSYLSKNQIVNNDEGREPLVRFCAEAFRKCSYDYKVFTNKKYKYKGRKGEIDVLVVCDDEVLIIECKEPLIPTSNFEMRATFEVIEKASNQLDYALEAFSDVGFYKKYFKDSLKQSGKNRKIRTCIVLGNRLFSIWNGVKHPVRYAYEMDMILNSGMINSQMAQWSIWRKDNYSHMDLVDFLKKDGVFNTIMLESMDMYYKRIKIYGKNIKYECYLWNLEKFIELCNERLRIIKKNELPI